MAESVRIALDGMGGDVGASVVVPGAALFLETHPNARFRLFGDEAVIGPLLASRPALRAATDFTHSPAVVRMDDKPSVALRRGRRGSSMWMAIEAVKKGEADVAVSAGNTGALMAMAKFCLRTLAQVDRPALAGLWPTLKGRSVALDLGASIGADAAHYVDLAVMGAAMASVILGVERPSVGLLNVGVEEIKGLDEVRSASAILRATPDAGFDYRGFIEGDDIGRGVVDVVVTEGFTGNIALKTAEGTARQIAAIMGEAMRSSWTSKLGYMFARSAFDRIRREMDPRRVNGGVFLGLAGLVVKSHGGTDALGFAGAIDIGYQMAQHNLLARIGAALTRARASSPAPAALED
jgi:glycerol-3-phosphate acyltransferase PlsX